MILERAKCMLLHNAAYNGRHREKIYKVFELSIAYNMILNALCAPNYAIEYDKTMAVISSMISPEELQTYRIDIGERRYALLIAASKCDADGVRCFPGLANT